MNIAADFSLFIVINGMIEGAQTPVFNSIPQLKFQKLFKEDLYGRRLY